MLFLQFLENTSPLYKDFRICCKIMSSNYLRRMTSLFYSCSTDYIPIEFSQKKTSNIKKSFAQHLRWFSNYTLLMLLILWFAPLQKFLGISLHTVSTSALAAKAVAVLIPAILIIVIYTGPNSKTIVKNSKIQSYAINLIQESTITSHVKKG